MKLTKKIFFIAFIIIVCCLLILIVQKSKCSWNDIFKKDLKSIHDILKENHPGYYDDQNPAFKKWLDEGYQQATSKLDYMSSFEDYIYGLRLFVNGFQDGHLRISFDKSSLFAEWPGFCISYQKGKFLVVCNENNDVPLGAELVSCDGELPRVWLEKNICPYIDPRHLEASLITTTPYLTLWEGTTFVSKPKIYTFKINDKINEKHAKWKKISLNDYFSKFPKKVDKKFEIIELGSNQVWIKIPSFYPQTQQDEDALNNLIDSMSKFKAYDLIIFDVRGNTGGNSYFGTLILKNLYGEQYYDSLLKNEHEKKYVDWRASAGNIEYLKQLIIKLEKQFGKDNEVVSHFSNVLSGMQKDYDQGKPLYTQINTEQIFEGSQDIIKPINARIVVITDNYCASACLNFLDELFALDSVTQIGLATNADTNYMECRDIVLPSSFSVLHFPIKVFRNRTRKSNEAYIPQYHVDDIYNDEFLKDIIQNIIITKK